MYIVIEGIDTAGKSTQLNLLKETYKKAIFTKEPGGTRIGQQIRTIVLDNEVQSKIAEMFLFLADRAEHYREIIQPNKDRMIISDRSFISGISYANEYSTDKLYELNMLALKNVHPNLVIVLELSRKELEYRLSQKTHDNIEKRGIDYLLNIQNNMLNFLSNSTIPYVAIDASKNIDTIYKLICIAIEKYKS